MFPSFPQNQPRHQVQSEHDSNQARIFHEFLGERVGGFSILLSAILLINETKKRFYINAPHVSRPCAVVVSARRSSRKRCRYPQTSMFHRRKRKDACVA